MIPDIVDILLHTYVGRVRVALNMWQHCSLYHNSPARPWGKSITITTFCWAVWHPPDYKFCITIIFVWHISIVEKMRAKKSLGIHEGKMARWNRARCLTQRYGDRFRPGHICFYSHHPHHWYQQLTSLAKLQNAVTKHLLPPNTDTTSTNSCRDHISCNCVHGIHHMVQAAEKYCRRKPCCLFLGVLSRTINEAIWWRER